MLKRSLLINSRLGRGSAFSLNLISKQYRSSFNEIFYRQLNSYSSLNGITNDHLTKLTKLKLINRDHQSNLNYFKINRYFHQSSTMAPNTTTNNQQTSSSQNDSPKDIVCKFGVLTDAQYANIDNRPAWYDLNKTRYYKDALIHLKKAFDNWSKMKERPLFVLQLGDLIDGLNIQEANCNSLDALEQTFKIFEEYGDLPIFHAVGNHELYNFSRSEIALLFRESLINRGRLNPDLVHLQLDFHDLSDENMLLYYSFIPQKGIKAIALDCFDISIIGHSKDDPKYKAAEEILKKHNHSNFDLWDFDTHLEGLAKRFQTQNGALSDNQLNWLRNELEESKRKNEKVIVFGHTCVHPDSCDASCLLYNYDKVLEIFGEYKNQVICYLSGHAHQNGYTVDNNGIHYLVLHGIIETNPEKDAFSTITINFTTKQLIIEGSGVEQSLTLPIQLDDSYEFTENTGAKSADKLPANESESTDKFTNYDEPLPSSSVVEVSV